MVQITDFFVQLVSNPVFHYIAYISLSAYEDLEKNERIFLIALHLSFLLFRELELMEIQISVMKWARNSAE